MWNGDYGGIRGARQAFWSSYLRKYQELDPELSGFRASSRCSWRSAEPPLVAVLMGHGADFRLRPFLSHFGRKRVRPRHPVRCRVVQRHSVLAGAEDLAGFENLRLNASLLGLSFRGYWRGGSRYFDCRRGPGGWQPNVSGEVPRADLPLQTRRQDAAFCLALRALSSATLRAIWLERGHVLRDGAVRDALSAYAAYSAQGAQNYAPAASPALSALQKFQISMHGLPRRSSER